MNARQRTMIRRIADLAIEQSDEHRAHLDRFHVKREALGRAEIALAKARARSDNVKANLAALPKDRRESYEGEALEELRDAENVVLDLKETMAHLTDKMQEIAAVRDRARSLSKALLHVAKTTHPDFSAIDVGHLQMGNA